MRRAADVVLILGFVLAILLVPYKTFFGRQAKSTVPREFRAPAPKPVRPHDVATLRVWPAAFDAWYRDHFGFRAELIRWHNLAKMELFEISPTSEIALGPDFWMYTTRDRAVEVFRGADPFSDEELELWVRVLEDRRTWCAERGIEYVFAIAPNKETIYPEFFPARFDKIGPTRREQLIEFVRRRSDFPLLDLTDVLLAEKTERGTHKPLYFPLGTHWNDIGAVCAYRALIERVAELESRVKPRPESDFTFEYTAYQDDSWAGRLYVEDLLIQDNDEVEFTRAVPREFWKQVIDARQMDVTTPERTDSQLPRVVMFHDSMGEKLRPLIAEHFSHARFLWVVADFDTAVIEAERPDVVIQLFVERALAATSLSNSPMDTQTSLAREFEAATVVLASGTEALTPHPNTGNRKVELTREAGGAVRIAYEYAPVYLPEFDIPPSKWALARFDLEAPADTLIGFEFLTERFKDYSTLARGFTRTLPAGRSTFYVKFRVPGLSGRVRFHFGGIRGDYMLRALEVRAVAQ